MNAKPPPSVAEKQETTSARLLCALRLPPHGEDYTILPHSEDYMILQVLVSVDMKLLFTATVFDVSSTLMVIDNMGKIGESLWYLQCNITTFVSLISI